MNPAVYHYVTILEAIQLNNSPNSHPAATDPAAFDARTQRVLELRRQIADGSYHIDHAAIVTALLREHSALAAALATAALGESAAVPTIGDFSRFVIAPAPAASKHEVSLIATA